MKCAVISGATGAIGTALITELIQKNIEVLVLCRNGSERNANIPKHRLVTKMCCDLKDFEALINDSGKEYDVFYHFAWMGTTGDARNDMFLQNLNVKYALDAVKLAKRFGCKTFIGAGSQAEYGRVEGILKPETPTNPETGYGIAKLCAGQMTKGLCAQMGLEHIWVRVLSVYGPNDTPNSMVMSTVNKLKAGVVPEFTKGEQLWDYLYSGDAARAFYLLGEKGVSGKTYVLGSGKAKPLKEYIKDIQALINPDCELRLGAIPYSDKQVMHLEADITELVKDTGFEPLTRFEDGMKNLI
ncbi:MAG: NAD-dependent epimerase/dehydratase family protein [Clostridia bacterium]|nr:NAD-dependent epimerase/dehydratase family protein [Clostridia bacterium]